MLLVVCALGLAACGESDLVEAAQRGDLAGLRRALAAGARVNTVDRDFVGMRKPPFRDRTALHWASQRGDVEAVRLLLQAGADIEIPCNLGSTALAYAAESGSPETVAMLLEAGADVLLPQAAKYTPLRAGAVLAARPDSVLVVAMLLEAMPPGSAERRCVEGVLENLRFIRRQEHAFEVLLAEWLRDASSPFDMEVLVASVRGSDLDQADELGWRPVHWAAGHFGERAWLDALIEAGADVNASTKHGWTPLMNASLVGDLARVQALLAAGANVNAENEMGSTALHIAALWGSPDLVRTLIKAGASVTIRSATGRSPERDASYNKRPDGDEVRRLIEEAVRQDPVLPATVRFETDPDQIARVKRSMRFSGVEIRKSGRELEAIVNWYNPRIDGAYEASIVHGGGEVGAGSFCAGAGTVTGYRFTVASETAIEKPVRLHLRPSRVLAAENGYPMIVGEDLWFDEEP